MSIPRASMSESYLSKCTTCQSMNVGLVQKSRTGNFHDILTFSGIGGIVNILLNTQGEREKTKEKQNNITCLKTNSCLTLTVPSTPPQGENVIYQKELTVLLWLRKYTENFTASPK